MEFRVSHLIIVVILLVIVLVPILIFFRVIPGFWIFTRESMDKGLAGAQGYTAASTPGEAMDKFREAIHARKYDIAAYYTTKAYGDNLKKTHEKANKLGGLIDKIRNWADNKSLMTDKLKVTLFALDPFPTNFKAGDAPKMDGEKKAYAAYKVETPYTLRSPFNFNEELKNLDHLMFKNVLSFTAASGKLTLVKEGDEWKRDIPVTPAWEAVVNHFNERAGAYNTALDVLWSNLNNERLDTGAALENDVITKLRTIK